MTPPPTTNDATHLADRRSARIATVAVLAIALAASLSLQFPFLSNDGPTHAYGAFVHNHFDDAALAFPRFVTLHTPPSAHGPDVVFRVVDAIAGWRAGLHAMHVVGAELFAFAFFAFVLTLDARRFVVALLGFPLAIQTALYAGLLPFLYGTAFAFVALTVWLRGESVKHVALVGALLVVTGLCHPFPVGAVGVFLGLVTLARNPPRRWPARLAVLLIASLPALALVYAGTRGESASSSGDAVWDDAISRTLLVARNFQPGGAWRPLFALGLAAMGAASIALAHRARRASRTELALALGAVAFLVVAMALPGDVGSWQLANLRPLPFAFVPLIASIDVAAVRTSLKRALVVVVSLYALSSFAWAASTGLEVRAATSRAMAGLDALKPEPRDWLPAIVRTEGDVSSWDIPRFAPLFHAADLYAMELGGITLFTQAYVPAKHDVIRAHRDAGEPPASQDFAVDVARAPTRSQRDDEVRKLGALASSHDGVIYVGDARDVALLESAGFVASYANDGVLVAHFEGCRGRVVLDDVHKPIDVEVGWWPRRTPQATLHIDPNGTDAHVEAPLAHFGCGDVWLHVVNARCRGSGDPVRATFAREHDDANVLACTLDERAR